jgi:hypothetical protein
MKVYVTCTVNTNGAFSGSFCVEQPVDILGQVANDFNPLLSNLEVIHTASIRLQGTSYVHSSKREPTFNQGQYKAKSNFRSSARNVTKAQFGC